MSPFPTYNNQASGPLFPMPGPESWILKQPERVRH